jgi:hypothetical protein
MKTIYSFCVLALTGCAVIPHGPATRKTTEYYSGRSDGLVIRDTASDSTFTRGYYFFADPKVATAEGWFTNQPALGGGSHLIFGGVSVTVDSNLAPAITAAGTATGNVIGAAVKSATK